MSFTKNAKWIGNGEGSFSTGDKRPALELRKHFTLDTLPQKAECIILGLGLYTLHINGRKVGSDVLSPAFTAYDKRALYLRYDVKEYLCKGENAIAVRLGDGFYNTSTPDVWNFQLASWRNSPRLLFELFADGKSIVCSDTSWKYRTNGPTVHNAIRTGEYYDARLADGWRDAGYCDNDWSHAKAVNPPGAIIEEMLMPPQRECETIKTEKIWKSENGWIFDFGKNVAGYVTLSTSAPAGTLAVMRYAELLKDGEIDQSEVCRYVLSGEFSRDEYTFRGEGIEVWNPEFVYHGFRYVEFSWDCGKEPTPDMLTAKFIHTDLRQKGSFTSSDELMNWIYDAGIRSFLSNYQGFPLDCPHREKNGWTGDAVISSDYAVCLFDMKEAYLKWMRDITDAQRASGQLPGIVPTCGWGYNWGSGPAWDYALFALPYNLYIETGDRSGLDTVYSACEKYLEYAQTREDGDGLVRYGLSDWCPPRRLGDLKIMENRLSDSCYYYSMNKIASVAARLKENSAASEKYAKKAEEIRSNIRKAYLDGVDLNSHGQGALAFFLYFDIATGDEAKKIAARLAKLLEEDGYVHKVGILGMKALPNALSKYGYTETAFRSLMRHDYPSYGYWKDLGETTLCEVWEENQSRNHHMYSDVVNWLVRNVAGVQNAGIAYDKATFKPYFWADECSAAADTETPHGKLGISWKRSREKFVAELTVPEGTEATLFVCGKEIPVKSGRLELTLH